MGGREAGATSARRWCRMRSRSVQSLFEVGVEDESLAPVVTGLAQHPPPVQQAPVGSGALVRLWGDVVPGLVKRTQEPGQRIRRAQAPCQLYGDHGWQRA